MADSIITYDLTKPVLLIGLICFIAIISLCSIFVLFSRFWFLAASLSFLIVCLAYEEILLAKRQSLAKLVYKKNVGWFLTNSHGLSLIAIRYVIVKSYLWFIAYNTSSNKPKYLLILKPKTHKIAANLAVE